MTGHVLFWSLAWAKRGFAQGFRYSALPYCTFKQNAFPVISHSAVLAWILTCVLSYRCESSACLHRSKLMRGAYSCTELHKRCTIASCMIAKPDSDATTSLASAGQKCWQEQYDHTVVLSWVDASVASSADAA